MTTAIQRAWRSEPRSHSGGIIGHLNDNAFEIVGPPGAPVIVVLGGISASRHVTRSDSDPRPGWWEGCVGPEKTIDTDRYRVLSIDYRTARRAAEPFSTHDQARVLLHALDVAEVERLSAIVGASYGGMVALAFGAIAPERTDRLVIISAAHRSSPLATAQRLLQRRVVALGLISGRSEEALVLARGIAITTYTSPAEFERRFGAQSFERSEERVKKLGDHLKSAGQLFADKCSAERFLALSESLDLHDVKPELVQVPTTLIAINEDLLIPIADVRELAHRIGASRKLVEISSEFGHDTFLNAPQTIAPHVAAALIPTGIHT